MIDNISQLFPCDDLIAVEQRKYKSACKWQCFELVKEPDLFVSFQVSIGIFKTSETDLPSQPNLVLGLGKTESHLSVISAVGSKFPNSVSILCHQLVSNISTLICGKVTENLGQFEYLSVMNRELQKCSLLM